MDNLGREKDNINKKFSRRGVFSVHFGSSEGQNSAKEGEVFRAEQAVLWGWKVEISTLLSKRVCMWKREVGTTSESYCPEVQMARRRPGFGRV